MKRNLRRPPEDTSVVYTKKALVASLLTDKSNLSFPAYLPTHLYVSLARARSAVGFLAAARPTIVIVIAVLAVRIAGAAGFARRCGYMRERN